MCMDHYLSYVRHYKDQPFDQSDEQGQTSEFPDLKKIGVILPRKSKCLSLLKEFYTFFNDEPEMPDADDPDDPDDPDQNEDLPYQGQAYICKNLTILLSIMKNIKAIK